MLLPTNKTIVILKLLAFLVANVTAPNEITEIKEDRETAPDEITEVNEDRETAPNEITEVKEDRETAPNEITDRENIREIAIREIKEMMAKGRDPTQSTSLTIDRKVAYVTPPDPKQEEIELKYFNEMYRKGRLNMYKKACKFETNKKAVLCQGCFKKLTETYRETYDEIFIIPQRFTEDPPKCDVRNLKFSHPALAKEKYTAPKMYRCFGRHDPLHTSMNMDEYSNFIYIGDGPRPNSVVLYKRVETLTGSFFLVIDIFDVNLDSIGDTLESVNIEETKTISFHNRGPLLERVYLIESYRAEQNLDTREIKKLTPAQVGKLCATICSHERYTSLGFKVDEKAYESKQKVVVELERVVLLYWRSLNRRVLQQNMVSCYGTDNDGQPQNELVKIWLGPRPNSAMAYIHHEIGGLTGYRPYQFVENIDFDKLYRE